MPRSITARDVAERAEVSLTTVSRVLNNRSNINEDVRQRVLKIASELGYFKAAGQGVQAREEKTLKELGFFLNHSDPDEGDTFWAHILHGAANAAHKANVRVTYQTLSLSQTSYMLLSKLHDMRVGGMLLVGPAEIATVRTIQTASIPLVLVDNYVNLPEQPVDSVQSDNFEGARAAVNYLIKHGHRQIAFIGGYTTQPPNRIYTFERRKEGYITSLHDANLPVNELLIEACNVSQPTDIAAACKRLLEKQTPISAIFCVNDATAITVMKTLREQGIQVPNDISIVGFDDVDTAAHLTPALTTIRVNKEAMGAAAVKMLVERVADPNAISATLILNVELIERESVQPYSS